MTTTFIYALIDPRTSEIRYIGKSDTPLIRLRQHLKDVRKSKTYKNNWILELLAYGEVPLVELLDEVPLSQWEQVEVDYIRVFKAIGLNLVNLSPGGEGVGSGLSHHSFGKNRSPEICAKMKKARIGHRHSEATKAKMSAARIGIRMSNETKARVSAAKSGKLLSEEHKSKISKSLIGNQHAKGMIQSEKAKKAVSETHKGKPKSDSHKDKCRLGALRMWERRKQLISQSMT